MERILLAEPDYKNKFPPLGLMKIATYHRNKGDVVEFYKGEAPYTKLLSVNRVYITTLFTFHYDLTLKCISHYLKFIHPDSIYIGGIAATLLRSKFENDTKIHNIIERQLFSSSLLGYDDNVDIDSFPLDYDILDDISYKYPAEDNYFVYTTRGCPTGCEFCAVRKLEPVFKTTNNVIDQLQRVDQIYGQKRNILVMDNNILCSPKLKEIVENIRTLGFTGEKDYIPPNPFDMMLGKIERRKKYKVDYSKQLSETVDFIKIFANRIKRFSKPLGELNEIIESINESDDKDGALVTHTKFLSEIIEKYRNKTRMIRYVDFNQGIDAKRIKKRNMKLLSTIPIRPFRLACDKIRDIDKFNIATKLAIKNNVRHFSNYILYNWKDKPEDLWTRLNNATSLYTENGNNITGYSFPMKFSPIDSTDRRYIGKHWNKKYLNAINVIINVTNGVVAKERDFFHEAFGSNIDKYFELLRMPDEFIRQRVFFKENGLIQCWKTLFHTLEKNEKAYLLHVLCKDKISESYKPDNYPKRVKKILVLYKVNKLQMEKGKKSYQSIINEIELIK